MAGGNFPKGGAQHAVEITCYCTVFNCPQGDGGNLSMPLYSRDIYLYRTIIP